MKHWQEMVFSKLQELYGIDIPPNTGGKLKEFCEENKLTYKMLAKKLDVNRFDIMLYDGRIDDLEFYKNLIDRISNDMGVTVNRGHQIKSYRDELGLIQYEFGARYQVSQTTISVLENSKYSFNEMIKNNEEENNMNNDDHVFVSIHENDRWYDVYKNIKDNTTCDKMLEQYPLKSNEIYIARNVADILGIGYEESEIWELLPDVLDSLEFKSKSIEEQKSLKKIIDNIIKFRDIDAYIDKFNRVSPNADWYTIYSYMISNQIVPFKYINASQKNRITAYITNIRMAEFAYNVSNGKKCNKVELYNMIYKIQRVQTSGFGVSETSFYNFKRKLKNEINGEDLDISVKEPNEKIESLCNPLPKMLHSDKMEFNDIFEILFKKGYSIIDILHLNENISERVHNLLVKDIRDLVSIEESMIEDCSSYSFFKKLFVNDLDLKSLKELKETKTLELFLLVSIFTDEEKEQFRNLVNQ